MNERPRLSWVGSVVVVTLATGILVAILFAAPAHRELALRGYVILLEVVGARLLVRGLVVGTWTPQPRAFDLAVRPPALRARTRASEPSQIAHDLGAATSRAMELHYRLRPRLRAIAADRLAARHGLALDEDAEEARLLLGQEAWELLGTDREPPEERFGPGMPVDRLTRIVSAVEGL